MGSNLQSLPLSIQVSTLQGVHQVKGLQREARHAVQVEYERHALLEGQAEVHWLSQAGSKHRMRLKDVQSQPHGCFNFDIEVGHAQKLQNKVTLSKRMKWYVQKAWNPNSGPCPLP